MPNITLSIPDALKKQMDKLPEVNWSEATRGFLSEKVKRALVLKKMDDWLKDSTLTEEDCIRLGRKAKEGRSEELKKQGLV